MSNIKLFQDKKIRAIWNEENPKWYFVVEDMVTVFNRRQRS